MLKRLICLSSLVALSISTMAFSWGACADYKGQPVKWSRCEKTALILIGKQNATLSMAGSYIGHSNLTQAKIYWANPKW